MALGLFISVYGACPVGRCPSPSLGDTKRLPASLPTDVDECASANGGCEGPCCNTVGGFYCRCPPGYQLQGDGKTCQGRTCLVLCPGVGRGRDREWVVGAGTSSN